MTISQLQALENIHRERMGRGSTASQYDEAIVPPVLKRAIAVYEAARVLMGYITPDYDEISQVRASICKTILSNERVPTCTLHVRSTPIPQ